MRNMATIYKKIDGLIWKTTIPNSRIERVWEPKNGHQGCVEYITDEGYGDDISFDEITGYKRKPDHVIQTHNSIISELKKMITEYEENNK